MRESQPAQSRRSCDCGQIYYSDGDLLDCQSRNHGGSAEKELADAEQCLFSSGVDPYPQRHSGMQRDAE